MEQVFGKELKVGDTISVWWGGGRDTITKLVDYNGPLSDIFPEGAQIASFAINRSGMTIENGNLYEVVGRISSAA